MVAAHETGNIRSKIEPCPRRQRESKIGGENLDRTEGLRKIGRASQRIKRQSEQQVLHDRVARHRDLGHPFGMAFGQSGGHFRNGLYGKMLKLARRAVPVHRLNHAADDVGPEPSLRILLGGSSDHAARL